MIGLIFRKIFGTRNDREVRRLRPLVARINQIEQELQSQPESVLREKTAAWKAKLTAIQDTDELKRELEAIMPEAFAVVKNACRRLCGTDVEVRGHPIRWEMVPFDVQLIGGMGLHLGRIAEMATGEGKTLVGTLPVYLNALSGRGVHVVTVNDYLASRDSEWMGHVYQFLGLTVGCILHDQPPSVRREMYHCDITYGTNAEFGFDYLRDNGMATRKEEQVQRGHYFAIVDEVDSILIDEARTPLIISGPAVVSMDQKFVEFKPAIQRLVHAQQELCNRFLREAEPLIAQLRPEGQAAGTPPPKNAAELEQQIGMLLYRVKLGQPRSDGLRRLFEEPRNQQLVQRYEALLLTDQSKKELYAQKEELFFAIEEKSHEADLTEKGRAHLSPDDPDAFVLPDLPTLYHQIDTSPELDAKSRMEAKGSLQAQFEEKAGVIHALSQLLKAYCLYERDVQYVVQDNKVIIVDEHTGRLMTGRRWSEGLHQAVEAKENVQIERETQTLATITIQNYFRLYTKLAGMTGTAETEASEFHDIYRLPVVTIPTHRPCIRVDENDIVFKTRREKFDYAVKEIVEANRRGQPVLVGTASVEASEALSRLLTKNRVSHNVLNAKQHQREAEIITLAGQRGAVTIATNMAGRGTDIRLGEGVRELGGLYVLGTERHESRRVDRQLRGRCSRQGDPGRSRFLVSLEDDLMRLFSNAGIISSMLEKSFKEGEPLEHPLLNRSIGTAQKRVEGQNYSIRKRLLQYDDVLNQQRQIVYSVRNRALHSDEPRDTVLELVSEEVEDRLGPVFPEGGAPEVREATAFCDWFLTSFHLRLDPEELVCRTLEQSRELAVGKVRQFQAARESHEPADMLRYLERHVVLRAVDRNWQNHLTEMEDLRRGVSLRSYAQKDPLNEYKSEAYKAFERLMRQLRNDVCTGLFRIATSMEALELMMRRAQGHVTASGPASESAPAAQAAPAAKPEPFRRVLPKIGRNAVVRIRKGPETLEMKWKKAESLVRDEGWELLETVSE